MYRMRADRHQHTEELVTNTITQPYQPPHIRQDVRTLASVCDRVKNHKVVKRYIKENEAFGSPICRFPKAW